MKKIFAANWKLNKSPQQAAEFVESFKKLTAGLAGFYSEREIFIFPSAFSLSAVVDAAKGSEIKVGPQNVYWENSGAFTGENSGDVAKQMGAALILIGHSERRQLFVESNEQINKKIKLAQSLSLQPVFCVGETLQQRDSNKTEEVCFAQLNEGLSGIDISKKFILAYEPVWAIGTGKVATVEQVADIHLKLHKKLKALGFLDFKILYGGSVKAENAKELLQVTHVDGFLIGGASLDPQSFFKICL